MIKLLGFLDIISGLVFLGSYFKIDFPKEMIIFWGIYLILKALFFLITSFDLLSLIDISAGTSLIFLFYFGLPSFLLIIFFLFLLIKGSVSVFS